MKKSECFKKAQIAVLNSTDLTIAEKLEVLDVLLWEESFRRFTEEKKDGQDKQEADNG